MQEADSAKVYFYSPGKSSYYSNVTLWVLARYTTLTDGRLCLQPRWSMLNGYNGICLFYSRLDAEIQALHYKDVEGDNWSVWPLDDMNITEMLQALHGFQQYYFTHMVIGLSIPWTPVSNGKRYLNLYALTERFAIDKEIMKYQHPYSVILKFSDQDFTDIENTWFSHFASYSEVISAQNKLDARILQCEALKAYMSVTELVAPNKAENLSIGTWSVMDQKWIFTQPWNSQTVH